jgi:hypothetical protein
MVLSPQKVSASLYKALHIKSNVDTLCGDST